MQNIITAPKSQKEMNMTKSAFLAAYMRELQKRRAWAGEMPDLLARYMTSVAEHLDQPYRVNSRDPNDLQNVWTHDGMPFCARQVFGRDASAYAVNAAWRAIGGCGTPSRAMVVGLPHVILIPT